MPKETEIKSCVPNLYKTNWLETFIFAYMFGCIEGGNMTTVKAAESLQDVLGLTEREHSMETMKRHYHRQKNQFYRTVRPGEVNVSILDDKLTTEVHDMLIAISNAFNTKTQNNNLQKK